MVFENNLSVNVSVLFIWIYGIGFTKLCLKTFELMLSFFTTVFILFVGCRSSEHKGEKKNKTDPFLTSYQNSE